MRRSLRTQLTLTIMLVVLFCVALISFLSNLFIGRQFEAYVLEKEKSKAAAIADTLCSHYNGQAEGWDIGFVHGLGMSALYDGSIVKVYDRAGRLIWDAENHDMSLCTHMMAEISERMDEYRPNIGGTFVTRDYALTADGQNIGSAAISYYGPYFLSDNEFRFLEALNTVLAAIGALSLVLALAAGGFLARRIARPIKKTAHIAKQISQGNYGIRFEGKAGTREIDDLTAAVNHLAGALLEQENLRKRLTCDVAHELRTPLTAVGSHLEAMIEGVWEPTAERLQSCHEEIARLGHLVADLEKLAKAESEDLQIDKTPVDLLELARLVSGGFERETQQKGLALVVDGESCVLSADKNRLGQVVANLLENAIKYTPEGGRIRVAVKNSEDGGVLVVEDDGIGIPEEELTLIFERFYRTDESRNRQTGGAGIGLAIVKSIVAAHGGTVEATRKTQAGSRFTVCLPKRGKGLPFG
jgi:signal transduction histidine kinase